MASSPPQGEPSPVLPSSFIDPAHQEVVEEEERENSLAAAQPVVTLPGLDDHSEESGSGATGGFGGADGALETATAEGEGEEAGNIVVLHEVVVEELPVGEGDDLLLPGSDELLSLDADCGGIVTEPVDDFDVVGGPGGATEEEEENSVVEAPAPIGFGSFTATMSEVEEILSGVGGHEMATEEVKPSHPVTLPPVDDVPPDETLGDTLADKSIGAMDVDEAVAVPEKADSDKEIVSGGNMVTEVVEKVVTIVEETVTTVEEVVPATGEVVSKSVTDSVKVDEIVSLNETVATPSLQLAAVDEESNDKKRQREQNLPEPVAEQDGEEGAALKKVKADAGEAKPAEEVMADGEVETEGGKEEAKVAAPVTLGPKVFNASVDMFSYFYNLLHDWSLNQNVNKYEFLVLSELINKGNPEKVGVGISAFQVRMHPSWQSRCYFLIRSDGSTDDFSYRKCVDKLMPLPESLFRANGELDLEKLFPGQKGRHYRDQNGGRGGGRGDRGERGGRGGGGFRGGRGGGGRGGRGGGGRGKGGRWGR